MRQIPMVLQEANVFIDGQGYLGVTKNFKIPTLEQEMIEHKGALSANLATGCFKPLEVELKIKVLDINLYKAFGNNVGSGQKVPLLLKGSIFQEGKKLSVAFAFNGDFVSIEHSGGDEAGGDFELTLKVAVWFAKLECDGKELMLYDFKNMIATLGGVDYMSRIRSNLGE